MGWVGIMSLCVCCILWGAAERDLSLRCVQMFMVDQMDINTEDMNIGVLNLQHTLRGSQWEICWYLTKSGKRHCCQEVHVLNYAILEPIPLSGSRGR